MNPDKITKVLKAIPDTQWTSAAEISKKTGISGHLVAGIINSCLIGEFVEKPKKPSKGPLLYRRLQIRGEIKTGFAKVK